MFVDGVLTCDVADFYKHLMKDEVQSEKQKPAIKVESSPEVEARPANPDNLPWLDDRPEWLSPPPHVKRKLAKEASNEVASKKLRPTISPNVEAMVGSSLPTPTAPKGPPSSRRRPPKDSSQEWFDKWSTADGRIRPDAPPAPISLWFKEREQAEREAAASRLDTSSTADGLLRPDSILPAYDRLQKQRHDQLQKEMREQAERELERQRLERRFRRLRDPPRSPGGLKRKAAEEPSADSLTEQTPLPPLPNKRPRTSEHRPASSKTPPAKPSTSTSSDEQLERIASRGAKLLNEIAVKEAAIKSELKEAQLKEVRIKAELLEVQLLEAQMAQEVSKAKLQQVKLEKELQEIKEKDERVKAKLEAAAVGKGKVVDLLDDEEDT